MSGPTFENEPNKAHGPTWKAVAFGMLSLIPTCYATANLPQSSIFSLLAAPIGLLLILVLIRATLGRFLGVLRLETHELLFIFAINSVGAAVSAEWSALISPQAHVTTFLAEGNPVIKDRILSHLPDSMVVKDIEAVRDISVGRHDASYVWSKLATFAPRLALWSFLVASIVFAYLFIGQLVRGLWADRERLNYPVLQLPLSICQFGSGSVWRSKFFWGGLIVMMAIDLVNGLNYLSPSWPRIPIKQVIDTTPFLQDMPWKSVGEFKIGIYPFLAALAFFMPTDLLISLIFFFLLRKGVQIILGLNGVPQGTFSGTFMSPGPPFLDEQVWGGIIALCGSALWLGRGHLKAVWAQVRAGAPADDGGISHRSSFAGLLLCFAVFAGIGGVNGLPIWISLLVFVLALIFGVVIMRIRAQLGPPTHEFAYIGPTSLITRFFGTTSFSDQSLIWLNHVFLFLNRFSRTHPAPAILEALKVSKLQNIRNRNMAWCLAGAIVGGLALGCWFYLVKDYRLGSAIRSADGVVFAQNALTQPRGPDPIGMGMTGFGFFMVLGLEWIRLKFATFPFHPIGYVLGMSYGIDYYWFGLTLALGVKTFVQRYAGLEGYEKVRQAVLGIMVAEYAAETIWMIIALTTKQSTYTIGFEDRSLGIQ